MAAIRLLEYLDAEGRSPERWADYRRRKGA